MLRGLRLFAVLAGLSALAPTARAQFNYPGGYGGFGWGGWGASTVDGNLAQGMGAFAAGAGAYNVQSAQAAAINANTAMQWNNYMWEAQQVVNRNRMELEAASRKRRNQARTEIFDRVRNSPTTEDVNRGDALNVILDELNSPKVYLRSLKGAGTQVGGAVIRKIPFQRASAAITTSLDNLVQGGPPAALKVDDFKPELAKLKTIGATLREKTAGEAEIDPATLKEAREVLRVLKDKVAAKYPANSRDRRAADNYLKALFGLSHLLETPALGVLLAGVNEHPEATLGDLLSFMKAYNFRFGVASQPDQRQIYGDLYRQLVALRNEAFPAGAAAPTPWDVAQQGATEPPAFFSGMAYGDLDPATPPPAPGPAANPAPAK